MAAARAIRSTPAAARMYFRANGTRRTGAATPEAAFTAGGFGSTGDDAISSTAAMKRYPRRGNVSRNRGVGGRIAQRLANPVNGFVQPVVKVDQRISGPQLLLQLLAGDNLTGPLQQCREDFKCLIWKLDAKAVLAQFP